MESVLHAVFLVFLVSNTLLWAHPVVENQTHYEVLSDNSNDTNGTAHDLTIVYEVGILTDADNDTDSSNDTHEQMDLTFYDPAHNSSVIDLTKIRAPVQMNVSGQIVTGIAPTNFGTISLKDNDTHAAGYLPLNAIIYPNVLITHTTNLRSSDPTEQEKILDDLPAELGI